MVLQEKGTVDKGTIRLVIRITKAMRILFLLVQVIATTPFPKTTEEVVSQGMALPEEVVVEEEVMLLEITETLETMVKI